MKLLYFQIIMIFLCRLFLGLLESGQKYIAVFNSYITCMQHYPKTLHYLNIFAFSTFCRGNCLMHFRKGHFYFAKIIQKATEELILFTTLGAITFQAPKQILLLLRFVGGRERIYLFLSTKSEFRQAIQRFMTILLDPLVLDS